MSDFKLKEDDLEFLRKFDLNHVYGPCCGVTRLERWEWADSHNLDPPERIKTLINANLDNPIYTEG